MHSLRQVNDLCGIKESDTGLSNPSQWDLPSDKQAMQEEQPLQASAARISTPFLESRISTSWRRSPLSQRPARRPLPADAALGGANPGGALHEDYQPEHGRGEVRHQREADRQVRGRPGGQGVADRHRGGHARGGGPDQVPGSAPCALSCLVRPRRAALPPPALRPGASPPVRRASHSFTATPPPPPPPQIHIPLPAKIDPSVTMMTVEEKPDVTYNDIGGSKEQIEKMREVVELPLLHPEKFVKLGIDPPKGVLCYGPPGTGKTLLARAVANRTDACFIRVIGSELVQKYVGEGARMVRAWVAPAPRGWRAGASIDSLCIRFPFSAGARALPDGAHKEGVPHLLRRGGRHRRRSLRRRRGRRQRGTAAHHAGC